MHGLSLVLMTIPESVHNPLFMNYFDPYGVKEAYMQKCK
jgi:hypothetical protein